MPKKEAKEVEQIELATVTVRAVNEGGAEVRFSDDDGKVSLVFRGHKTLAKKLERGVVGKLIFIPDPVETEESMVTVKLPASDTGGLPTSAEEVKSDSGTSQNNA